MGNCIVVGKGTAPDVDMPAMDHHDNTLVDMFESKWKADVEKIWSRPFYKLPVHTDIPRLCRKIVLLRRINRKLIKNNAQQQNNSQEKGDEEKNDQQLKKLALIDPNNNHNNLDVTNKDSDKSDKNFSENKSEEKISDGVNNKNEEKKVPEEKTEEKKEEKGKRSEEQTKTRKIEGGDMDKEDQHQVTLFNGYSSAFSSMSQRDVTKIFLQTLAKELSDDKMAKFVDEHFDRLVPEGGDNGQRLLTFLNFITGNEDRRDTLEEEAESQRTSQKISREDAEKKLALEKKQLQEEQSMLTLLICKAIHQKIIFPPIYLTKEKLNPFVGRFGDRRGTWNVEVVFCEDNTVEIIHTKQQESQITVEFDASTQESTPEFIFKWTFSLKICLKTKNILSGQSRIEVDHVFVNPKVPETRRKEIEETFKKYSVIT